MRNVISFAAALGAFIASSAAAQDSTAVITSALSAAPPAITARAGVMDMNQKVLRQSSNGWMCMPDLPAVPNDSPMCADSAWADFPAALTEKRAPRVPRIGFAYMLRGDQPVSNKDPFAKGPTADNEWLATAPPHVMIVVPDPAMLAGLPTDPKSGGPWVMWKGTPYAHIMLPVPAPK